MPNKTLLLFSLLLFSGKRYSLSSLAKKFNCNKSTIIRNMENIELSSPALIETEISQGERWYQLKTPPSRPQLSLSHDEIEKLVLCRDLLEHILPTGIEGVISAAIEKTSMFMEKLDERALAISPKASRVLNGRIDYTPFQGYIECLLQAIKTSTVCAIEYQTPSENIDKKIKNFDFVPVRLLAEDEVLNVEGWCVTAKGKPEIRFPMTLAIQRMHSCVATRIKLAKCPTLPEKEGAFGLVGCKSFPVRVRFCPYFGTHVRERIWSEDQTIIELSDGSVELCFSASSEYSLVRWVLNFGAGAELLEPEFLREQLLEEIEAMYDFYAPEEDEIADNVSGNISGETSSDKAG